MMKLFWDRNNLFNKKDIMLYFLTWKCYDFKTKQDNSFGQGIVVAGFQSIRLTSWNDFFNAEDWWKVKHLTEDGTNVTPVPYKI